MPMTAIVLAQEYSISSTVIDSDPEAVALSRALIRKLGLQELIKIESVKGEEFNYAPYSVVVIAALAGMDESTKQHIFAQIKQTANKGTHILARSSWKNRKLLYKPLSSDVFQVFQPVIQVNPFNEIVNSLVIFKYV